jgi:hypothetical protein
MTSEWYEQFDFSRARAGIYAAHRDTGTVNPPATAPDASGNPAKRFRSRLKFVKRAHAYLATIARSKPKKAHMDWMEAINETCIREHIQL